MVEWAAMESKADGTMFKEHKNCLRKRCRKWPCILSKIQKIDSLDSIRSPMKEENFLLTNHLIFDKFKQPDY